MVDRDTVQEILTESKRRIDPKTVPPQARLILRECKLLPEVGIQPLYVWIPPPPILDVADCVGTTKKLKGNKSFCYLSLFIFYL